MWSAQLRWTGVTNPGRPIFFQRASVMLSASTAHVVAIDLFLAGQVLRPANRLGDQYRIENGAVIEDLGRRSSSPAPIPLAINAVLDRHILCDRQVFFVDPAVAVRLQFQAAEGSSGHLRPGAGLYGRSSFRHVRQKCHPSGNSALMIGAPVAPGLFATLAL